MTQSLRALLTGRGIRVHAALTRPTGTDMTRGFDIPKTSSESVARAVFDGIENEEEDIFPDPMSQTLAESWRGSSPRRSRTSTRHSSKQCPSHRKHEELPEVHEPGVRNSGCFVHRERHPRRPCQQRVASHDAND